MVNLEYDIQVTECRKKAHNVSLQIYTDAEIETKITLYTSRFHKKIGRTTPYTLADNPDEYRISKLAIIALVAYDLLNSIDQYKEDAKGLKEEYDDLVENFTTSELVTVSSGINITDELDPPTYTYLASDTVTTVND